MLPSRALPSAFRDQLLRFACCLGGRRAAVIGAIMCTLMVFLAIFAAKSESGMDPVVLLTMLAIMGILVGG